MEQSVQSTAQISGYELLGIWDRASAVALSTVSDIQIDVLVACLNQWFTQATVNHWSWCSHEEISIPLPNGLWLEPRVAKWHPATEGELLGTGMPPSLDQPYSATTANSWPTTSGWPWPILGSDLGLGLVLQFWFEKADPRLQNTLRRTRQWGAVLEELRSAAFIANPEAQRGVLVRHGLPASPGTAAWAYNEANTPHVEHAPPTRGIRLQTFCLYPHETACYKNPIILPQLDACFPWASARLLQDTLPVVTAHFDWWQKQTEFDLLRGMKSQGRQPRLAALVDDWQNQGLTFAAARENFLQSEICTSDYASPDDADAALKRMWYKHKSRGD